MHRASALSTRTSASAGILFPIGQFLLQGGASRDHGPRHRRQSLPVVALARRLPSLEIGIVPSRERAPMPSPGGRFGRRCAGSRDARESRSRCSWARPGPGARPADHPSRRRRENGQPAHVQQEAERRRADSTEHPAAHPEGTLAALRSQRPVRGPINSDFGARRSFWRRQFHTGIDIAASRGTPVRAPMGGTVTFAGWRGGYGRTIIIDHGGEFRTLYGHLSRVGVRRGQRVESGAAIGATGASGNASGPHLHYEILAKGRPINPRGPVPKPTGPHGAARGPGGTIPP